MVFQRKEFDRPDPHIEECRHELRQVGDVGRGVAKRDHGLPLGSGIGSSNFPPQPLMAPAPC
jgi:hypothetical protein